MESKLCKIKKIIAIFSAKGGVGKSTICSHLAKAYLKFDKNVGILDADIHGPSIPEIFKVNDESLKTNSDKKLIPILKDNIKILSINFLINKNDPVIWRSPMTVKAIKTFLFNSDWENTNTLFIDLPPGTGDIIITLSKEIKIDGAVIVTTPQTLSINDNIKGIKMLKEIGIPIIGIIENMSFLLDSNNNKIFPFGKEGGQKLAQNENLELIGKVKIDNQFSEDLAFSETFYEIAKKIYSKI